MTAGPKNRKRHVRRSAVAVKHRRELRKARANRRAVRNEIHRPARSVVQPSPAFPFAPPTAPTIAMTAPMWLVRVRRCGTVHFFIPQVCEPQYRTSSARERHRRPTSVYYSARPIEAPSSPVQARRCQSQFRLATCRNVDMPGGRGRPPSAALRDSATRAVPALHAATATRRHSAMN